MNHIHSAMGIRFMGPDPNLDETTRKFLAKHLRGEIKFARGNRRTFAAKMEDARVLRLVTLLEEYEKHKKWAADELGIEYKPKGGQRVYLEQHPDRNEETLKSQLKRARKDKRESQKKRALRVNK